MAPGSVGRNDRVEHVPVAMVMATEGGDTGVEAVVASAGTGIGIARSTENQGGGRGGGGLKGGGKYVNVDDEASSDGGVCGVGGAGEDASMGDVVIVEGQGQEAVEVDLAEDSEVE